MKFQQLLGSPAGKWVSEFLVSYNNRQPDRLGHLLITGVAVWMTDPSCDLPTLLWTLEPYKDQYAHDIANIAVGNIPEPLFVPAPAS